MDVKLRIVLIITLAFLIYPACTEHIRNKAIDFKHRSLEYSTNSSKTSAIYLFLESALRNITKKGQVFCSENSELFIQLLNLTSLNHSTVIIRNG